MKKDTADAFGDDPAVFGGTALLEALARQPNGPNPVLVGHSTGAVYIAHLIDHAAAVLPPDRKFDVVLLAPAIDFELMARMLGTHGDRIERLRVFCMQDQYEQRDRLVSVAYPRSLLYFVSGALEGEADTPIVGMQRFYETDGPFAPGRVGDIDAVRAYLQEPERAVWSIADSPGGLSSNAVSHGDFDNDPVTLASVSKFIANGGGPDGG
jgi:hypothetical protein